MPQFILGDLESHDLKEKIGSQFSDSSDLINQTKITLITDEIDDRRYLFAQIKACSLNTAGLLELYQLSISFILPENVDPFDMIFDYSLPSNIFWGTAKYFRTLITKKLIETENIHFREHSYELTLNQNQRKPAIEIQITEDDLRKISFDITSEPLPEQEEQSKGTPPTQKHALNDIPIEALPEEKNDPLTNLKKRFNQLKHHEYPNVLSRYMFVWQIEGKAPGFHVSDNHEHVMFVVTENLQPENVTDEKICEYLDKVVKVVKPSALKTRSSFELQKQDAEMLEQQLQHPIRAYAAPTVLITVGLLPLIFKWSMGFANTPTPITLACVAIAVLAIGTAYVLTKRIYHSHQLKSVFFQEEEPAGSPEPTIEDSPQAEVDEYPSNAYHDY